MEAGENNFALHAYIVVEHKHKSSINKHFATAKHNYRIAELQAGRQTTRQITMTQAVASKSIAIAERIKNQLFIGPFIRVFVLLIKVFFSDYLMFNIMKLQLLSQLSLLTL